jgi:hypothetical protein
MRTLVLTGVLTLLLASAGLAQETPAWDVSGGYSFLRDQDIEENLHGWLFSASGHVNDWLEVVGEVGGNYKSISVFGSDVNLSVHSFLGGPRVSMHRNPTVSPFGHVLFGGARASGSFLGEADSATDFALQPGGGVDVWFRRNLGVRVGADYRRIFSEGEGVNEFRFHAGIVLSGRSR